MIPFSIALRVDRGENLYCLFSITSTSCFMLEFSGSSSPTFPIMLFSWIPGLPKEQQLHFSFNVLPQHLDLYRKKILLLLNSPISSYPPNAPMYPSQLPFKFMASFFKLIVKACIHCICKQHILYMYRYIFLNSTYSVHVMLYVFRADHLALDSQLVCSSLGRAPLLLPAFPVSTGQKQR